MIPELFKLPFINVTVKSYGVMMVVGFLFAVLLMRNMARRGSQDPDKITNIALYALITGVIGARIFYVFHNFDQFRGNLMQVFALWEGGLEFVGGVILAIVFVVAYVFIQKVSALRYFDILVVGLMLGLAFGRIGCFLFGCCFGKPTECPVGVSFPYRSPSYYSQVYPDQDRDRQKPRLELPNEYFGHYSPDGKWVPATEFEKYHSALKPKKHLTDHQHQQVTQGKYQALPVHPTQLYSSANAFLLCGLLYLFWRKVGLYRPGSTFSLMFIAYGTTRFMLETIRDDNPFEHAWWAIYKGGTISQNIGIYMVIVGLICFAVFIRRPKELPERK